MKTETRYLVIPMPILTSDELTAEEKFMLSLLAMLTEENGKWEVNYDTLKKFFEVSTATLCTRLTSLGGKGFITRDYPSDEPNASAIIALTEKSKELFNLYRLEIPNPRLKKPNDRLEIPNTVPPSEKVIPIEKQDLTKDKNNSSEKDIKEEKIKTEKDEKVPLPIQKSGRLFSTMYSDKKVVNDGTDKKAIIEKMFTYAKMEFTKYNISNDVIKQFQVYLSHMLTCRKVSGEHVKALVSQLIKFLVDLGYHDDEVIEILQESMLRNWLYFKEIKDLIRYRELKESRRAKTEDTAAPLSLENTERKREF